MFAHKPYSLLDCWFTHSPYIGLGKRGTWPAQPFVFCISSHTKMLSSQTPLFPPSENRGAGGAVVPARPKEETRSKLCEVLQVFVKPRKCAVSYAVSNSYT